MSVNIVNQRVIQYTNNLQLLSRQMGSRLRGAVDVGDHRGKQAVAVDQIGLISAQELNQRHGDSIYTDVDHKRRWVYPKHHATHALVDMQDEVELLVSPQSKYAQAHAAGHGLKMDQDILLAAVGTSVTGETATGTEAFDTTNNRIAHGSVGFTFDKLNQAVRILREQMKNVMEPIYCAVAARGLEDLLGETKVGSADYNTVRVLMEGKIQTFMGVTFIWTEACDINTSGSTYSSILWARSGLHLGIWKDIEGRVDELPGKNHSTQVSAYSTFGATRTEQAKVVEVQYQ